MYMRDKRKITLGDLLILFMGILAIAFSILVLWGMTQIPY